MEKASEPKMGSPADLMTRNSYLDTIKINAATYYKTRDCRGDKVTSVYLCMIKDLMMKKAHHNRLYIVLYHLHKVKSMQK